MRSSSCKLKVMQLSGGQLRTRLVLQRSGLELTAPAPPGFPGGGSLGEALLVPTTIYARQLRQLLDVAQVKVPFLDAGMSYGQCTASRLAKEQRLLGAHHRPRPAAAAAAGRCPGQGGVEVASCELLLVSFEQDGAFCFDNASRCGKLLQCRAQRCAVCSSGLSGSLLEAASGCPQPI